MDYLYWVYLHVAGVLLFVMGHGVSVVMAFKIRKERDPARMLAMLQLSTGSISFFYVGILLLLAGGVIAGFMGDWWDQGWIWTALITFVLTMFAMYGAASNYYKRLRTITEAMVGGSQAVSEQQLAEAVSGPRPYILAGIGYGSLLFILYLMIFKPF